MRELVELGAPELPEGMFYRVSADHYGLGLWISIRKETRFGSRELVNTVIYPGDPSNPDVPDWDTVPAACVRLAEKWQADNKMLVAYGESAKYIGDHK